MSDHNKANDQRVAYQPTVEDWGTLGAARAEIVALKRELLQLRKDAKSVAMLLLDNDKKHVMDWARGIVLSLGRPGEVERLTTEDAISALDQLKETDRG